ncbi:hypothetical protein ACLOJK_021173 [Asimina triloba]
MTEEKLTDSITSTALSGKKYYGGIYIAADVGPDDIRRSCWERDGVGGWVPATEGVSERTRDVFRTV